VVVVLVPADARGADAPTHSPHPPDPSAPACGVHNRPDAGHLSVHHIQRPHPVQLTTDRALRPRRPWPPARPSSASATTGVAPSSRSIRCGEPARHRVHRVTRRRQLPPLAPLAPATNTFIASLPRPFLPSPMKATTSVRSGSWSAGTRCASTDARSSASSSLSTSRSPLTRRPWVSPAPEERAALVASEPQKFHCRASLTCGSTGCTRT
jgi:hypothetical protein